MARTKTKPVGRTPTKRRDCEVWLLLQLTDSPSLARDILALAANSGWGWATVRRAKANVGAQSFRKGEEWWWFDPRKFDPKKDTLPQKYAELSPKEPIVAAPPKNLEAKTETPLPSVQRTPQPPAMAPAFVSPASQPPTTAPQTPFASAKSFPQQITAPLPSSERPVAAATVPAIPTPEPRNRLAPAKPRPFHIWDSAHTETRDSLISAAGFADLYNMRLDIRFRQEQLRAKGLLREEAALNELLVRVNDALEKKRKAESLE